MNSLIINIITLVCGSLCFYFGYKTGHKLKANKRGGYFLLLISFVLMVTTLTLAYKF